MMHFGQLCDILNISGGHFFLFFFLGGGGGTTLNILLEFWNESNFRGLVDKSETLASRRCGMKPRRRTPKL